MHLDRLKAGRQQPDESDVDVRTGKMPPVIEKTGELKSMEKA